MRILITAGGSGGHISPALGIARVLQKENHTICFFTTKGLGEAYIKQHGFEVQALNLEGLLGRGPLLFLVALLKMIPALFFSFRYIQRWQPDIIVGFGGYGSVPVVMAGVMAKVPALIHEQNVVPGQANRWLARWVNKVAISFERTRKYFPASKVVLTGCPMHLRPVSLSREELLTKYHLKEGRATLLALGGSQGSHVINETFAKSVEILGQQMPLQVIHICGKQDYEDLQKQYRRIGIPFALFSFLDPMEEVYALADIVVARAGALTIFELVKFNLPAILIPYPFANAHQKDNAFLLQYLGKAKILEQKDLSAEKLGIMLKRYLKEQKDLAPEKKKEIAKIFITDAEIRMVDEIKKLAG